MREHSGSRGSLRVWLMALTVLITTAGCAGTIGGGGENGPEGADTPKDVLGVWQGTSLANCQTSLPNRCNAQQLITISLLPPGDNGKIGGYYRCAYGNLNCFNMNTTGKVALVTVNRSLLSVLVMMPDGTSCRYQGRIVDDAINGGYSCSSGGSQFEQGTWRSRREY
ncbi:MAG: hypothetical protein ABSG46_12355 [Candidatus Binataceae bacterium]